LASLPAEFRKTQPELQYQQQIRLTGGQASVFIGDSVAGVSLLAPYPGWADFRPRIDAFLDVLKASRLVKLPERISLKFVNLLTDLPQSQLDSLNVSLKVAGQPMPETGFQTRFELNDAPFRRIIEIAAGATLSPKLGRNGKKFGLILSIDCIRSLEDVDFWTQAPDLIETLHTDLRTMFFRLVSSGTVATLGPVYAGTTNAQ
jgi:uncharacterized protein (TIGR04255 family)